MRSIGILVLAVLCSLFPAAARQEADPPFKVQEIAFSGLPGYDLKVSPDGRTAAAFVGQTASALLNYPFTEYVPDLSVLPIYLIDLTTGTELGQLIGQTDYATDVAFTPDSQQLLSYQRNGDMLLWDIPSKKLVTRLTSILGGPGKVKFLPDGKHLLTQLQLGFTGNFLLWDMESGSVTRIWHEPYQSFGQLRTTIPDSLDSSYSAFDISPDGTQVAAVSSSGQVALWDIATLRQTILRPVPSDPTEKQRGLLGIRSVVFTSDGKRLVFLDSTAKQLHIWDVAAAQELQSLPVDALAWGLSPAGDALAWVSNRTEVWYAKLDQLDRAVQVMTFPDNLLSAMPTLAFSPDASQLVVGGFLNRDGEAANVLYIVHLNAP